MMALPFPTSGGPTATAATASSSSSSSFHGFPLPQGACRPPLPPLTALKHFSYSRAELEGPGRKAEETKENLIDTKLRPGRDHGSREKKKEKVVPLSLEGVNPVGLGRKSRQMFDEVWRKFSGLGQISRTPSTTAADGDSALLDSVLIRGGPMCEFSIPGAQETTVLVVGATSKIGRIVIRKLMLRGYNVKALVRKADPEVIDMLPRSVTIVVGDVGDLSTLKAAVEGCNKIIYCATARSAITGDLNRVDNQGVRNVTKAFLDYNNMLAQLRAGKSSKSKLLLAKFKSVESLDGWEVRQGTYFQDDVAAKYDGGMDAKFEFTESGDAVFSGYVFTRGGYVELSKQLSLPLGSTLDRYDGLLLSVGGNGRSYVLILEAGPLADTSQSKKYFARMTTKVGYCRVRIPFSSFRPVKPEDPPLDPFLVHTLTIRFEPRRQKPVDGPGGSKQDPRSFKLIMEYIKALPDKETGKELLRCPSSGTSLYPISSRLASVGNKQQLALIASRFSGDVWHRRLGHPSLPVLSTFIKNNKIVSDSALKLSVCNACNMGKHVKLSFHDSESQSAFPFHIVHSDVWQSPVPSVSGYKYYVIFIDDYSRFSWLYLLKFKHEVFDKFFEFKKMVENIFHSSIKIFQSDNGTEFVNDKFSSFCSQNGIIHRFSCPYTPQQNGLAERKHRHLSNIVRSLLFQAGLPPRFWAEAIQTAVFLVNRLPSLTVLNGRSPYDILHGCASPDLQLIRVFGCLCYPDVQDIADHKLSPRSLPCIFLGLSDKHKGFRCLYPSTG
ncbi:uncharacterized protein LOC109711719 isoform X2 [Ananas comosus]|uniref:Uncharacterized protein LOC109711719 isoform X2 n=1 Tax=Ananas comosus TaxID=4615 RepID=A0A6P5F3G0_ANACO|nr:uncharacterized protein LOC109711719 isoform X2 [Ananas comosus]